MMHWQKVGSDGWFHFNRDPNGSQIVELAIGCKAEVRKIVATDPLYAQHILKVVMGINEAKDVQVDPGGPFDDDSIIAYYLLNKKHRKYDLRATGEAVSHLVGPSHRQRWIRYDTFTYPHGRRIDVFGQI